MDLPGIEDPVWQDGTFAKYDILDENLKPDGTDDLYCCTFTGRPGRCGYLIFFL